MSEGFTVTERIEAARTLVRNTVTTDTVIFIHPFDMASLLKNPLTQDACLINMFDKQFVVVDGAVYEQVNTVKNTTKIREMMAPVKDE